MLVRLVKPERLLKTLNKLLYSATIVTTSFSMDTGVETPAAF